MTAKTNLFDLPAGQTFPALPVDFSEDRVARYLEVLDGAPLGTTAQFVPPEAAVTFALGALLDRLELPPGAMHVSQEARVVTPQPIGAETVCLAGIAQRSRRGGMAVVALDFTLVSPPDAEVHTIEGTATILAPDTA